MKGHCNDRREDPRRRRRALAAFITLLIVTTHASCGGASRSEERTLRVAVAASFLPAMESLREDFKSESGSALQLSVGSSGALFAQIRHGAPFGVFLSADLERPRRLASSGLAIASEPFVYAKGRIVLLFSDRRDGLEKIEDLGRPEVRHIAIAHEAHAPYGHAAIQALRRSGELDAVSSKLVRGESVGQAFAFFRAGGADAAIVAESLAIESGLAHHPLDQGLYDEIRQAGALLGRPPSPDAVALRAFLLRPDIRERLRALGYH